MSLNTVHYFNVLLGFSAIILQILTVLVLFLIIFYSNEKNIFLGLIKKYFLEIGFFISLLATAFSLFYSEIIGFAPCQLCWFQRIFLFPQVFLFGVALWNKDKNLIKYSLPLTCVGFVISIYQNFIYYFNQNSSLCDINGVSCVQRFINEFGGYISIPMLSLTSFFVLLVIVLVAYFYKDHNFL